MSCCKCILVKSKILNRYLYEVLCTRLKLGICGQQCNNTLEWVIVNPFKWNQKFSIDISTRYAHLSNQAHVSNSTTTYQNGLLQNAFKQNQKFSIDISTRYVHLSNQAHVSNSTSTYQNGLLQNVFKQNKKFSTDITIYKGHLLKQAFVAKNTTPFLNTATRRLF